MSRASASGSLAPETSTRRSSSIGSLARTQQQPPPALAARQDPSGERRQQACAEDRRLAAPRGADDAEEAGPDEARDELGDEPLAAEEVVGVDRLEAREPLERADALGSHVEPGVCGPTRACACSRASWRSTTLPVSSASTSLRSLLPAAAREATSTSRRLASSTATSSAARASSRQLG